MRSLAGMTALLVLLFHPVFGQIPAMPPYAPSIQATVLNGSTQDHLKSSPSGLDLNGPELITVTTTFDANITGWSADAGSAIAHETSIKRTGAGSMRIICGASATGAAKLTTPIANTTTNKVTAEVWVYVRASSTTKVIRFGVRNESAAVIGSETQTTVTADTWTRFVVNVQLAGTQTAIQPYPRFVGGAAGDTMFVDDVLLRQAKDALAIVVVNQSAASGTAKFITTYRSNASATGPRLTLYANATTELFSLAIDDSISAVSMTTGGTSLFNGRWNACAVTLDRTGNAVKYLNGAAIQTSAMTAIGNLIPTSGPVFAVGASSASGNYFPGSIGPVMVVIFPNGLPSDIPARLSYVSMTWMENGFPSWLFSDGQIVLDVNWEDGGLDRSGLGNHLTPVGSPPIEDVD